MNPVNPNNSKYLEDQINLIMNSSLDYTEAHDIEFTKFMIKLCASLLRNSANTSNRQHKLKCTYYRNNTTYSKGKHIHIYDMNKLYRMTGNLTDTTVSIIDDNYNITTLYKALATNDNNYADDVGNQFKLI